jgi:hypothetical protein
MANATFKKGLILFVLTLVFSFSTSAQKKGKLKEFSKDFPIYLTELSEFMTASDNSDLKTVFKYFSKNSSELTGIEQEKIILIYNISIKFWSYDIVTINFKKTIKFV